jgi:hypothetical protein
MNRYNCLLIVGSELKPITIEADTVHPNSTCATRFQRKYKKSVMEYGGWETGFELVAQYPTDRLIIESIEEIIDNID